MIRALSIIFMAILLVSTLGLTIPVHGVHIVNKGLLIVVTFPSLTNDIEQLISHDDHVISIVPPGTDPHEYQLTISDIEILHKADIIISTGHTPFENRIRELVNNGEIKAILIEIPKINGIKILNNPATGLPNLHMPIYDPINYITFINNITETMQKLRPSHADTYNANRLSIISKISYLLASAPRIYLDAVADKPLTQYAVSWLGIRIRYLIIKEPGVPATPSDLNIIRNEMAKGRINLAIITEPAIDASSQQLIDMANEYNVPILYVPSPLSNATIIEKLSNIASQVTDPVKYYERLYKGSCIVVHNSLRGYEYLVVGGMVIASITTLLVYIVLRRREEIV